MALLLFVPAVHYWQAGVAFPPLGRRSSGAQELPDHSVIPHKVVANYLQVFESAASLHHVMLAGANHGLSRQKLASCVGGRAHRLGHEAMTIAQQIAAVATADFGYLRLRTVEYGDDDLRRWLDTMARVGAGWRDAFVFFKHEEASPRRASAFQDVILTHEQLASPSASCPRSRVHR
jgi:Protein of unknown function DUF72